MSRQLVRSFLCIVLCQFIVSVSFAQQADTTMVFPQRNNSIQFDRSRPQLSGIVSVGVGPFNGFRSNGQYSSVLQPNLGFDFLAEPGGAIHLLLGGRLGISDPLTTEVNFGFRLPLGIGDPHSLMVFSDLGLLFFSDDTKESTVNTGVRVAFGARTYGWLDMEYRLAGEFRGSSKREADNNLDRTLWWVGAEVGVSFSLVGSSKVITHRDSLRASLHYIASPDELDEFDYITSNERLDEWVDRFWRRRDVTPSTRINEARMEYERRVSIANEQFSHPKKLGVLTDPGRILAIYGQPDGVETAFSSYNERYGYVLWVYRSRIVGQSLGVFLFTTDPPREWKQTYSNVPGETTGPLPGDLPQQMMRWIQ
jgi:GWxTD domain-containing protein